MAQLRWALITGVSQYGTGGALTEELLGHNISVIATGPTLKQLEYLNPNRIAKLEKLELDVTSPDSIAAAVSATERITGGKLDFLVNNAGYGYMMPLMDADINKIRKNFDVNVFGLLAVTQAFFPLLREAKGMVVNQASITGLPGLDQPYIGTYSASKRAVVSFSNTMRVELAPFGIKVVTLITGDVATHFWGHIDGGDQGIPDSSPYLPIKAYVDEMMLGKLKPKGAKNAAEWAKSAVKDLLSSRPPARVYRGFLSTTMRWVTWLTPTWALDWSFASSTNLSKLKTMLKAEERKGRKKQ